MVTIEHDGFTIETSSGTEESVRESLGIPAPTDTPVDTEPEQAAAADAEPEAVESTEDQAAALARDEKGQFAKKAKPRDNPQARINQALERQRLAEQRAQDAERRIQDYEARLAQQQPPAPKKEFTDPEPTLEQFSDKPDPYASWQRALAAYDRKKERFEEGQSLANLDDVVAQKVAALESARQQKAKAEAFQASLTAGKLKYPDLEAAMRSADEYLAAAGVTISPVLEQSIIDCENPAEVLHWLATHTGDLIQLARDTHGLDVVAAPLVRQLLAVRTSAVSNGGSASPAPMSHAKPPIKPVGASPISAPSDESEDEPFENYFKRANAADRKAGRL